MVHCQLRRSLLCWLLMQIWCAVWVSCWWVFDTVYQLEAQRIWKPKTKHSALLKLCATLAVFWSLSAFIWRHTPTWFLQLESSLLKSMIKAFFLSSIRNTRHWALQNCSYHRTIQTCSNYYVELCASVKVTTTMFLQSKQVLLKALKQGCWTYFTSRTT